MLSIASGKQLKQLILGVPVPMSGNSWDGGKTFAAGISVAIDDINQDPTMLPGYNLSFVWEDSMCLKDKALNTALDMYYTKEKTKQVSAIIGPACSDGCEVTAMLGEYWNIPIVSYGCASQELSDHKKFGHFARTVGPYSKSVNIFVKLMREFSWDRLAIITPSDGIWLSIMDGVRNVIENDKPQKGQDKLQVSYYTNYAKGSVTAEKIRSMLQEAERKSHIFLLGGYKDIINKVLKEAKDLGMLGKKKYVFIVYELLIDQCQVADLKGDTKENCINKEGLLEVSLYVPALKSYEQFKKVVKTRMSEFGIQMSPKEQVLDYAAFLYDAALLYAHALNKTLNEGGQVTDGKRIIDNMLNYSFKGKSGDVNIDEYGDRKVALKIQNFVNNTYKRVGNYFPKANKFELSNTTKIVWPGGGTDPPIGRPECGFDGEFCEKEKQMGIWVPIMSVCIVMVIILLVVVFVVMRFKRQAFEQALLAQQWRIKYSDLQFSGKLSKGGSKAGIGPPHMSNGQVSQDGALPAKTTDSIKERADSKTSLVSDLGDIGHDQIFTRIGLYDGSYVAIKQLRKTSINLTRDILLELKLANDLNHQNIAPFIGACVEPPKICILTQYCNKGSVQDVLYNDNLKLDWMFQLSIASDIARGMAYLHSSPIAFHGNLKSSNCVVDSRWVCKITDFGLLKFKYGSDSKKTSETTINEDQFYTDLLWKAPEHIDNPKYPHSQPGDVYGYGIILQEILMRAFPYCMHENVTAQEVVKRVKASQNPPFRPKVSNDFGKPEFIEMMEECWSEYPGNRPKFDDIMKTCKKLNGGKNINIVDNMIHMMEKYTDHLEDLVMDRTKQLEEEKAKTDELLYRMLPRSVAESLKDGNLVQAETFDLVTIFFSDIVGFTKIAAESTPLQVVDLLNDLYTCFDTICDSHDVYKVETIGDAYMLVSGLPVRNENRHAGEIAKTSLDLLSACTTFKIRHKPETQLQLRIGIHSGSCVAGVVGLKMPRYCLFGDTVNYASRMESSGLALRVHVSPECQQVLNDLGGYSLVERGPVSMKGKGTIVTYFLAGYEGFDKPLPDLRFAAGLEEHSFK